MRLVQRLPPDLRLNATVISGAQVGGVRYPSKLRELTLIETYDVARGNLGKNCLRRWRPSGGRVVVWLI